MRTAWRRITGELIAAVSLLSWRVRSAVLPPVEATRLNRCHWMMRKTKLNSALGKATASLLLAQRLTSTPENREKLIQAELLVRLVLLSECPEEQPPNPGHHGG